MNIKPLSDHILIEPIKEEEKTKAGIFLPETANKEKSEEGKVVDLVYYLFYFLCLWIQQKFPN